MAKFEKGNPGRPGRPVGSRNTVNRLLDGLVNNDAETIVRKMIEAASDGDRVAARLVLNRVWSAPRGRPVQLALPPIRQPADLVAAHAAVVAAIAAQEITPQDGAALSAVLETHRRAFELVGQEKRVEALEAQVRHLKAKLT
jgi:hypothetical protein